MPLGCATAFLPTTPRAETWAAPSSIKGSNLSSDATLLATGQGSHKQTTPGWAASRPLAASLPSSRSLQTNSPAVDAISVAGDNAAPSFDGRNALRVSPFDIGAYELNGVEAGVAIQASSSPARWCYHGLHPAPMSCKPPPKVTASNAWSNATQQPITSGWRKTVTIAPAGQGQFFRLHK